MSTYSLNKNSLSVAIGLTNNVTIGRIVNENRHPSQKTLQLILTKFSNIDANWLFSGTGEMYISDFDQEAENVLLSSLSKIDNSKNVGSKRKKMSVQMSGDSQKMSVHNVGSQENEFDNESQLIINKQMVKLLIDETKELSGENALLKKENTDLKAENAGLKAENAQLKGNSSTSNKQTDLAS